MRTRARVMSSPGALVAAVLGVACSTLPMATANDAPAAAGDTRTSPAKPVRARDLGVPLRGTPGSHNAITDVDGVLVGHSTIITGRGEQAIRTGVTAVRPTPDGRRIFAATVDLNGNGELTGAHLIHEWGVLLSPILLTNTLSVGTVHAATVRWSLQREDHPRVNLPVVAETWDGRLNHIDAQAVQAKHVFAALDGARGGPVVEGNVGGGTGMMAYGFKSGIGTASRRLDGRGDHVVGVLVQANHGARKRLVIAGVPVGRAITDLQPQVAGETPMEGSIIVVIATDAPLLPHQLERVARRASHGLARTGTVSRTWSGEMFVAFSTAEIAEGETTSSARFLPVDRMDAVFAATVQATEEAIVNALVAAETMTGYRGNRVHALPHDRLRALMETAPAHAN